MYKLIEIAKINENGDRTIIETIHVDTPYLNYSHKYKELKYYKPTIDVLNHSIIYQNCERTLKADEELYIDGVRVTNDERKES